MNRSRDKSDPTLMLAILAVLIGLAAWQSISNASPGLISSLAVPLAPVALGAVALTSALATQRSISTRRTLRSRSALVVVPADEFEASVEQVIRFASQLSQADRGVRGWLDRRASAIRFRLERDGQGRLVFLIEAPSRTLDLLRTALHGYVGVELREPGDVLDEQPAAGWFTIRTELELARPSVEPLARLDLDPDPLQPFAATLAESGTCDQVSVCVDLLPATGRRRARLRRLLRREARKLGGEGKRLGERLGLDAEKASESDPALMAERRQRSRGLDAKLRDGGALFEAQILLRTRAGRRSSAKASMQNLLAAFESLGDRNWLKVSGLPIPGLAFLGSDLPFRCKRFDRRLDSGFFRPARRNILSARELAGFLKPPTIYCTPENVLRSGALLPSAPELPALEDENDLIPIGKITDERGERLVGVRTADTFFTYLTGRSRYGKTELAICQFLHLVRSGHGGLFLDPHEDALERIKPYLTDPRVRERVVEINLGSGRGSNSQPGWNLFELGGQGQVEAEARVEAVVDAFASSLEWGERSTRAINLTTQAASALAAISQILPRELTPTFFQIPTLLSDAEWRSSVLPFLPQASRSFWLSRFPRLSDEAITPLTNMVDRLRASGAITALLGASESTYRVREAMDRGQIVLACPGSGGTRDRLIANLLVFDLLHAAKSRAELAPSNRKPFWFFADEVQSYDGAASGNLAALLEQAAKYGVRATLLNQNPERLSAATLNALTTNRSHLIATALNSHAAALVTREWGGTPDPAALTRLPKYRFIGQVTHRGDLSKPFALAGISVEEVFGAGDPEHVGELDDAIDATSRRRGTTDAAEHLESLDDRILEKLRELGRGGTPADGDDDPTLVPDLSGRGGQG